MKRATKSAKAGATRKRRKPLEEIVASNIARLRKERGWTQYDLADKLGRFQPWINRLERGRAVPTLRTLDELAKVFQVDPIVLLQE